jgi:D-xylose transport system ATP-binding protein
VKELSGFHSRAWVTWPPLAERRVAIVTTERRGSVRMPAAYPITLFDRRGRALLDTAEHDLAAVSTITLLGRIGVASHLFNGVYETSAFLGRSQDDRRYLEQLDPNDPNRKVLNGVSFNVRKGEILGIAGLMGSSRTELVTTLFGEYGIIAKGKIRINGREIKPKSAREAINLGLNLVPEDRKRMGLVLIQTILKNISLPNLDQFSAFFSINSNAELQASMQQAKSLTIKAPSLEVKAETLSGGNQQKVVISKWLLSKPEVLIMDDPTRGIDVGAKFEIYKLMNDLAEKGVAIIMISSDLEEVLGMSDRVMVMCRGHSTITMPVAEADKERVMSLATGVAVA